MNMVSRTRQQQLPVKITQPRTSLMYITSDREHIIELKEAIHVKEVAEAHAIAHQIARHKQRGVSGVTATLWLLIALIVLLFHLFLCKLICSEFCGPNSPLRAEYSSGSGVAAYKSILRMHAPDISGRRYRKPSNA